MKLRETKRVKVGLVASQSLDSELKERLRGHAEIILEPIRTSPYMSVSLSGPAFSIENHGNSEQIVTEDSIAVWEFDVTAKKHGVQTLTLDVSLRIPISGHSDGFHNVPVFERQINVTVKRGQLFADWYRSHWKWLVGSVLAAAGAASTWVGAFH